MGEWDTLLDIRQNFYFEYMVRVGRFEENGEVGGEFWVFVLFGLLVQGFCFYCFVVVALPFFLFSWLVGSL